MTVLILLAALAAQPVAAPPPAAATAPTFDPRAVAAVDKLLDNSGFDASYDAMAAKLVDGILPALVQNNTGAEQRIHDILADEMRKMIAGMKPLIRAKAHDVYLHDFTVDELEEMVRQADTPLGRKMRRLLPVIQGEMFDFGQEAGRAAMRNALPHIIDRMRAANLNVPKTV